MVGDGKAVAVLREVISSIAFAAAVVLAVLAAILWPLGGIETAIARVPIEVHDPFRPLLAAIVSWAVFRLAGGHVPRWATAAGAAIEARPAMLVPPLLVGAFLPAFSPRVVPSHDALQVFTAFWTYVSALASEGRLPEWIPFSRYGTPAGPVLMYLTPVSFVTGALGAVLHARWGFADTLLLFKITVGLEYLLFAAGVLKFGGLLFRSAWVRVVVTALAVFSSPWILSLDGNFHAFYMTPWILSELTRALQTSRPRHLGLAALLSAFASVGNVPYFPPFLLLQLFVFAVPLAWSYRSHTRILLLDPRSWLWLGLAGACFAVHFTALMRSMDGLAILTPGRDPLTNRVPKAVFLTYAGVTKPMFLLFELYTGRTTNGDNTFYMGLATLALVPMSALVTPTPVIRAVQLLAVFLVVFSTGGLIASLSYHFPGMAFYRHISIVFGLVRLLAFFCAGYVLDRCLNDPAALTAWRARLVGILRNWVVLGAAGVAATELVRAQLFGPANGLALLRSDLSFASTLMVRAGCYGGLLLAARTGPRERRWPVLVMIGLVLDLATFWAIGWAEWPRLTAPQAATMRQLATPRSLPDPGPRFAAVQVPSRGRLFQFVQDTAPLKLPFTTLYVHTYFWTGEDPCLPRARLDFLATPVADLFRRLAGYFDSADAVERAFLEDKQLARVLACEYPRVRSTARVVSWARGYDWIRLRVDNSALRDVPLAISEAAHPNWRVSVDGAPTVVTVQDGAFLGTQVSPGLHDIEFTFHAPIAGPLRTLEGMLSALAALWLLALSGLTLARPAPLDPIARGGASAS